MPKVSLPTTLTVGGAEWTIRWYPQTHFSVRGAGGTMERWGGYTAPDVSREIAIAIGTVKRPRSLSEVLLSFEHECLRVSLWVVGIHLDEPQVTRLAGALLESRVSAGTVDLKAWDAALRRERGGSCVTP